jgi:hypothetical protein
MKTDVDLCLGQKSLDEHGYPCILNRVRVHLLPPPYPID